MIVDILIEVLLWIWTVAVWGLVAILVMALILRCIIPFEDD